MNPNQLPCIQPDLDSFSATKRRRLQNRLSQRKFRQKKAQEQKLSETLFVLDTNNTARDPGPCPSPGENCSPSTLTRNCDGLHDLLNFIPIDGGISHEVDLGAYAQWQPQPQPQTSSCLLSNAGEMGQPDVDAATVTNINSSIQTISPAYLPPMEFLPGTASWLSPGPEGAVENPYAVQWSTNVARPRVNSLVASHVAPCSPAPSTGSTVSSPRSRPRPNSRLAPSTSPTTSPLPPLLHICVQNGNRSVLQTLLKHGSTVNERDGHGRTALHIASENGSEAMVSLLLYHGADSEALDLAGKSPLYLAVSASHNEVVDLLLSHHKQ